MIPIIYPYKIASNGAKLLAENLNCRRVRPNGLYKYKSNHLIINWGMTENPKWNKNGVKVLNHWDNIRISSNKLSSLQRLKSKNVKTPDFTTDINVAKNWIKDGYIVICRKLLRSHSGKGIIIARNENELVNAPLYTKYVNGKNEYRIHVYWDGINEPNIFDAVQKRKKEGFKDENKDNPNANLIRSHDNGFVFCRENLVIPENVKNEALKAIKAINLNFAGIDIRYIEKNKQAYVLECNSSCGLEGTTLESYTDLFKKILT